MPVIDVLRQAIQEKRVCRIRLADEDDARIVHPYGICVLSSGNTSIVAWQLSGFSKNGTLPGFRNLSFNRCQSVEMLNEKFIVNQEFDPKQKMYRKWVLTINQQAE